MTSWSAQIEAELRDITAMHSASPSASDTCSAQRKKSKDKQANDGRDDAAANDAAEHGDESDNDALVLDDLDSALGSDVLAELDDVDDDELMVDLDDDGTTAVLVSAPSRGSSARNATVASASALASALA